MTTENRQTYESDKMSETKTFQIYSDWLLVHNKLAGMDHSSIMDSDGNQIYDTYRLISVDEAAMYCRGFERGVACGKAQGELDTKTAIRRVLGL